jgi:CRP-like cAMP-binding protein
VVVARSLGVVVSEGRSKFARMTREDRLLVLELISSGASADEAAARIAENRSSAVVAMRTARDRIRIMDQRSDP